MQEKLRQQLDVAVMVRFQVIRGGLRQRTGNYIYSGSRCHDFGWRFRQTYCGGLSGEVPSTMIAEVAEGKWDQQIEATWHDSASAEHWYRYEKDYGRDDPEPEPDDDGSWQRIGGWKYPVRRH